MPKLILLGILATALASLVRDEAPQGSWIARSVADAEREAFLLEADVVDVKTLRTGVTHSYRVSLGRDGVVHDAHVQLVDEHKMQERLTTGVEIDFRDSWRNNVAAYRLDRLLGLEMVPVTVVRTHAGKKAAFTWWVDDVVMDEGTRLDQKRSPPDNEAWNRRMLVVRLFDQLIYNSDRNMGNLLIDKDWRVWMIDHTRAFKVHKQLRKQEELGDRCSRSLLAALRRLERASLDASMEGLLDGTQINGLLSRRDRIVRFYDERIADLGEDAVLYDLPQRP